MFPFLRSLDHLMQKRKSTGFKENFDSIMLSNDLYSDSEELRFLLKFKFNREKFFVIKVATVQLALSLKDQEKN